VQGKYQIKPPFPFYAVRRWRALVDAVGEGVSEFTLGDRVLAITHGGGLAEYSIGRIGNVFQIRRVWIFRICGMPIVYHTSYFAVELRARLQKGEWLLVHAGAAV